MLGSQQLVTTQAQPGGHCEELVHAERGTQFVVPGSSWQKQGPSTVGRHPQVRPFAPVPQANVVSQSALHGPHPGRDPAAADVGVAAMITGAVHAMATPAPTPLMTRRRLIARVTPAVP